jgi:hypothetical protein
VDGVRRDRWLGTEFLDDGVVRWQRWRCAHGHTRMVDRLEVRQQTAAGTGWVPRCQEGHTLRPMGGPEVVE